MPLLKEEGWLRRAEQGADGEGVNKFEGGVVPSLHHDKETSELLSQGQFFVCRKFGSQR